MSQAIPAILILTYGGPDSGNELAIVEQLDPPRIQQWQHVTIQIGLGFLGGLVSDVVRAKPLRRPQPGIAVEIRVAQYDLAHMATAASTFS